ncbi:MAG: N-acetylmuramoyl-L-alanine amidase [Butyrivibrio sp.]|nr:N-acetylmuramoyl-L-alanine amidase [Butyrivibrio sp.]
MDKKFIISWFRMEAGLLFFTAFIIMTFVCTGLFGLADSGMSKVWADENVVIVIDPGHGGGNLGAEYEDYTEKEITLITANAMKEELEKYEGITVYMTRTGDKEMSLQERCDFAASVNADFLFCLHYNMSAYHTLFGAETWISAFGEQYSKGYAFASIEIGLLQEMGLYSRGIKTRLNEDGVDYYGIIRHATEYGMPSVIIEHCHLDQINDQPFYDHKEKLEAFGRLDAEAVARYFGLRSTILGKDYSNYQNIQVNVPSQVVKPDYTEPDISVIELVEQDTLSGDVTIRVSAADYDSGMLYYTYSYDGGETFSELQRWPDKSKDTFEFTFNVPPGTTPQVAVNAYNGYDLYTTSNILMLSPVPTKTFETDNDVDTGIGLDNIDGVGNDGGADNLGSMESEAGAGNPGSANGVSGTTGSSGLDGIGENSAALSDNKTEYIDIAHDLDEIEDKEQEITISYFLKVSLVCVALIVAMVFSMVLILSGYKRRRR